MYKIINLFMLVCFGSSCLNAIYPDINSNKYPQIVKFVQKYRCSPEVEQLIADNSSEIEMLGNNVGRYKYIPYFNKGAAFDRIKNAKRLEKVLQDLGLDRLRVTKKWLCKNETSWFVIAEKVIVSNQPVYPLNLEEIEQLIKLTQATGYRDYLKSNYENIVRDEQGYLVIIDTEDRGFGYSCRECALQIMECMLDEKFKSEKLGLNLDLTTKQLLEEQREKLIFSSSHQFIPTLPNNKQYDDLEIDFEKLESEYACLQKEVEAEKLKNEYEALLAKIAMNN